MVGDKLFLLLGCLLQTQSALGVFWSCSLDTDCSSMEGSICVGGECVCPQGTQAVSGGTKCGELSPYHASPCLEDFQCSRLFTSFECRRSGNSIQGSCLCRPGSHYFRGRCWANTQLGENCTRDEQCQGGLRDPFAMSCVGGTCQCSEGYYFRQRGECRMMALAVGDNCVLDQDCHFEGGACGLLTLQCYDKNATVNEDVILSEDLQPFSLTDLDVQRDANTILRQHGETCDEARPCAEFLECASFGICICPMGYYPNEDASICLAELGSPVTSESQCVGFFTEVRNGVCTCQANFYFGEDMRTCVKAARSITDACLNDDNCLTFGVSTRCGEPQQWGLRTCECLIEDTVWDESRSMCRLFSGVGDGCDINSDCLAGDREILCVKDETGQGVCTCPPDTIPQDGLCLSAGLELGSSCQVSDECTGTSNAVCSNGQCSCGSGYQQVEDFCAPGISGSCVADSDCVVENSVCTSGTCQCRANFTDYQEICWPVAEGFEASCNVTAQCAGVLSGTLCVSGTCQCDPQYHYRDGGCWPRTGLFESCTRSSQCFLEFNSDWVHCRNSLCQCTFDHPYSEELRTCKSFASSIFGSTLIMVTAFIYLLFR